MYSRPRIWLKYETEQHSAKIAIEKVRVFGVFAVGFGPELRRFEVSSVIPAVGALWVPLAPQVGAVLGKEFTFLWTLRQDER